MIRKIRHSRGHKVKKSHTKFVLIILMSMTFAQIFLLLYYCHNTTRNLNSEPNLDELKIKPDVSGLSQLLTLPSVMPLSLDELAKIQEIKSRIMQENWDQIVLNQYIFGPLNEDSVVIVIQVHNRLDYLHYLIESLTHVQGIFRALLIFSHDVYDEKINAVIRTIDFCKVLQIFYPHSLQIHPQEFPGNDPNDCPRDLTKNQAVQLKCNNALYADMYGHYREARFTQTKHHWWWKANKIFHQLEYIKDYTGPVVFMEEDYYVARDFLHMLDLMRGISKEECPACNMLCLGTIIRHQYLPESWAKLEVMPWHSGMHNMGMVFNRSVWTNIRKCAPSFCQYDDYNWDFSLQHTSETCLNQTRHNLVTMVVKAPRVFHLGNCGMHHSRLDCKPEDTLRSIKERILTEADRYLFPRKNIVTVSYIDHPKMELQPYGGWGDLRDIQLCMNMTFS